MTEYICKCGKVVLKSTTAETTGNRLGIVTPEHECFGCPYILDVKDSDWNAQKGAFDYTLKDNECRMSKYIDYTTATSGLKDNDNSTGRIYTLDIDFIKSVQKYAEDLPDIEVGQYEIWKSLSDYTSDGKIKLGIFPAKNKKGTAAKKQLYDHFFVDGVRRDFPNPEDEKYKILHYMPIKEDPMEDIKNYPPEDEPEYDDEPDPIYEPDIEPEDDEPEEPNPTENGFVEDSTIEVKGKRVSLNDSEFSTIIYALDDKINRALKAAIDAKQGFTATAQIIFTPTGGNSFRVIHKTGYKFDPIKVEDKGELYDEIQICLDSYDNPIIPEDRQHQMSFTETGPHMTVTTDGSGVVQSIEGLPFPEAEESLYKCDNIDCPLYTGFNGVTNGCSFCGNVNAPLDDDLKGNIHAAVTEYGCHRDCIAEICNREFPIEQEVTEEPEQIVLEEDKGNCDNWVCMFLDEDGHCCFDPAAKYYGAPNSYMADESDIRDSVTDCGCQNPTVIEEYKKHFSEE